MIDADIKTEAVAQPGEKAPLSVKKERASGTAPKAQKERPKLKGPWMYVGPTASGIGVQNRVYTEIPVEAQERAEDTPEILHLFIPVKDYPRANKMLREKTGYVFDAYCKAADIMKGRDGA